MALLRDLKGTFREDRDRLLELIEAAAAIESVAGCACEELRAKLLTERFNLVVVGQFKRGKTTFINALLGADLLPTAVVPLTSVVTIVEHGAGVSIKVIFNDGRTETVGPERLADYVTEEGNRGNEKEVAEVHVSFPSAYLADGMRLIDTPGVGSVYRHNTEVAYEYLPRCDAAVFLISVDQPLSRAELDFLQDVRHYADRIFFLQNKADYLSAEDLSRSLAFTRQVLNEEAGFTRAEVYPVSSKLAMEGKRDGDEDALTRSGFPSFEQRLMTFLVEEKGTALVRSVAASLLRAVSESGLRLDLQARSLHEPLEETRRKLARLQERRREIEIEKRDFEVLLEGDARRVMEAIFDPDVAGAKEELAGVMTKRLDTVCDEHRRTSPRRLRRILTAAVVTGVRDYYSVFIKNEDTKVSLAFEDICRRHVARNDALVDDLLRFASELFAVDFDSFAAEAHWSVETAFFYKFEEEPLLTEALYAAFTSLLPRFIGNRIVRRDMKRYLLDMIEQQAGRMRWDFLRRLDRSRRRFRGLMESKIDETARAIERAVEKGIAVRERGEGEAESAAARLGRDRELISRIETALGDLVRER